MKKMVLWCIVGGIVLVIVIGIIIAFVVGMAGHQKKLNNTPAESSAMSGNIDLYRRMAGRDT